MDPTHRIWIKAILLVAGLFLAGGVLHAEGNCPAGYSPIGATDGQTGPQGCAPTPGYNQAPTAHWEDRWGAIATDGPGGSFGASENMLDRNSAEQNALNECHLKKGAICKIETWYKNRCAAMIVGEKSHSSNNAGTIDEAIKLGIQTCSNAGDTECHVYYRACSPAVEVQ
jgi:hypothetical protein